MPDTPLPMSQEMADAVQANEPFRYEVPADLASTTIFLFLITHAPSMPESSPGGIYTQMESIAAQCINADPMTAICDILGYANIKYRRVDFQVLDGRSTWMKTLLDSQGLEKACCKADYSMPVYRDPGLQGYHWRILLEMIYHSRVEECQERRPTCMIGPRDFNNGLSGLLRWLHCEIRLQARFHRRKTMLFEWYDLPIIEKIQKLEQVTHFLAVTIPATRAAEDRTVVSGLEKAAASAGTEIREAFYDLRYLRKWISDDKKRWERVLEERRYRGIKNPAYSGFPLLRHYREHMADGLVLRSRECTCWCDWCQGISPPRPLQALGLPLPDARVTQSEGAGQQPVQQSEAQQLQPKLVTVLTNMVAGLTLRR